MHVILWVFRATDLWMAASTCCLKIIHQDMSSVLNYVPCVPSCPTCLGALLVKVFYVLTCLTSTCFRGFSSYVPFFLFMSYVTSFFYAPYVPSLFLRVLRSGFIFYMPYVSSFFTCLTWFIFYLLYMPSLFYKCFQFLTCFTYLHLSL